MILNDAKEMTSNMFCYNQKDASSKIDVIIDCQYVPLPAAYIIQQSRISNFDQNQIISIPEKSQLSTSTQSPNYLHV